MRDNLIERFSNHVVHPSPLLGLVDRGRSQETKKGTNAPTNYCSDCDRNIFYFRKYSYNYTLISESSRKYDYRTDWHWNRIGSYCFSVFLRQLFYQKKVMKITPLVFIVLSSLFCASSASARSVLDPFNYYDKGWEAGTSSAVQQNENNAQTFRDNTKTKLVPLLFIFSIVYFFSNLFGAQAGEYIRSSLSGRLKLSLETQISLVSITYGLIVAASMIVAYIYAGRFFLSSIILIAGSSYPFCIGYVPSLKHVDTANRKISLQQIKSLLFMALVIIFINCILDGKFIKLGS